MATIITATTTRESSIVMVYCVFYKYDFTKTVTYAHVHVLFWNFSTSKQNDFNSTSDPLIGGILLRSHVIPKFLSSRAVPATCQRYTAYWSNIG